MSIYAGYNPKPNRWRDPELLALLKDLWENTKYSASRIALMLGTTRSAVIGKAHRMQLKRRKSPIKPKQKVTWLRPHEQRAR